jgi:hypothetical protein
MFFSSSKKVKIVLLIFIVNVLGTCFALQALVTGPTTTPAGDVALTIGTPSNTNDGVLFIEVIEDTMSKRAKISKPCGRTTQFSAGLHRQAQNQLLTELVTVCI